MADITQAASTLLAHQLLTNAASAAGLSFVGAEVDVRSNLSATVQVYHAVIEALSVNEPRDKTDMYRVLRSVAETFPRRGMMIVVSDLLSDREGTIKGFNLLRRRGHDVMVFHVMDDDELDFPFTGPTRFEGLELPDHLNCNPRALRDGYLEAIGEFLDEIRRGCAKNTVDYALVRTSDPLDAVLAAYLSNRLGMHHRN